MARSKRTHRFKQRNYDRRVGRTEPAAQSDGKTFLVVVEGQETERRYFVDLRARLELKSADVFVEHAGATDPKNMVSAAVGLRDSRAQEAQTSIQLAPYDEVWVVVDREAQNHPRSKQLPAAMEMAHAEGIYIALSNPCFEFWLLLHYVFTTKPFADPKAVIAALKKHNSSYKKNELPMEELFSAIGAAVTNAKACAKHHKESAGDGNPSTYPHLLVTSLNQSAAPIFRIL